MPRNSETKEDGFQNIKFHCIIICGLQDEKKVTFCDELNEICVVQMQSHAFIWYVTYYMKQEMDKLWVIIT